MKALGSLLTTCPIANFLIRLKATRRPVLLTPLALSALLAAGCGGASSAQSSRPPAPPSATAPPPRKPLDKKKAASPQITWETIRLHLDRADRDSASAVASQLAGVNRFFADRRQGALPFAKAVLGSEGKLQATGGLIEGAAGAIGELFGYKPSTGEDSFTIYVRRCFRVHVLDAGNLQRIVDASAAGYAADVRRVEGRLLVDLRADLDDAGFKLDGVLPGIQAGEMVEGQGDAMISDAVDAATGDFVAMIAKFAVSWVVGDAVGDQLTSEDDSTLKRLAVNMAAGAAVDKVLDEVIARAGYDPEGMLAAKVTASLERMRSLLVEGDPQAVRDYSTLCRLRDGYPDAQVAAACREAALAVERGGRLGLRQRLLALHAERSRLRSQTLRKSILGESLPAACTAAASPLDPKSLPSREQILQFVRRYRASYGVSKP